MGFGLFDDTKRMLEELSEIGEDLGELMTRGAWEMLVLGNEDFKTTREARAIAARRRARRRPGPTKGDILAVSRGLYEHFGVFLGRNQVIHYSSVSSDIGKNTIVKTDLRRFLRGAVEFDVLDFPETHCTPSRVRVPAPTNIGFVVQFGPTTGYLPPNLFRSLARAKYHLYSPAETVQRAKSRLGDGEYNIAWNNCEHFAIWCKTGVSESRQVGRVLDAVAAGAVYGAGRRTLTRKL